MSGQAAKDARVGTVNANDPRLRFRVFVDAQLVDETWVNTREPEPLRTVEQVWAHHQELIRHAQADDKPWLVEIYDPATAEDRALRFGTDETGIEQPILDLGALLRQVKRTTPK